MGTISGKVWHFGDNIDTDLIIAARYLNTSDPKELAKHVMEDADPEFVKKVKAGDIIVAGENFGCGSSREHAPIALKAAGVSAVVAKSFARIFYRNAFNTGLPIFELAETDALMMHATNATSVPPFNYLTDTSWTIITIAQKLREQGVPVYATMDAGPNVKLISQPSDTDTILTALTAELPGVQIKVATPGPGIKIVEGDEI